MSDVDARECDGPPTAAGRRSAARPLERYLVELDPPLEGWGDVQAVAARARAAAGQLRAEGTPVRFLRSVFVPEDDTCLFLYEAASPEAVGEAGRRAALRVQRVAPAVQLDRPEE